MTELPETTDRECTVCGAIVAAWPEVMCCHCTTRPWRKINRGPIAAGGEDAGRDGMALVPRIITEDQADMIGMPRQYFERAVALLGRPALSPEGQGK